MNELRDKVVMVHPTLTHDPVNMQGHMAKIISVDAANDEVMVRFKNQMLGLYEANALLMLIPGMEILDKLRSDSEDLDRYDMVDVLGIYLLDATGEEKYKREALDMAMSRADLMHVTVISVQDFIDLKRDFGEDVEQTRGR
jgi:hypothetical protein